MKKIVLYIITIIAIILLVVLLKNITTTKYTHSNIVALVNKGMQSMNNISFDKENENDIIHFYYKENNKKMVTPSTNHVSIALEDGKTYMIDKNKKVMFITNRQILSGDGFQGSPLILEKLNANISDEDERRYELKYMRDEEIDNKDCILVKECIFNKKTKKYIDNIDDYRKATAVYWIEKSSGIVIGAALMKEGEKKPKPEVIIKNIQYGNV